MDATAKLHNGKLDSEIEAQDSFELRGVEVETVRRAATERGLDFDPSKRIYTAEELKQYGLVREGYNRTELRQLGIRPEVVSSLDTENDRAEKDLALETPYGSGIRKWQLPVDMLPLRVAKTIFPPASVVTKHIHPPHTKDDPGGGLRIVVSGSVLYGGRKYSAGDWFFVPNGVPYEFTTDEDVETIVFYTYRFFGAEKGNRFSHPYGA